MTNDKWATRNPGRCRIKTVPFILLEKENQVAGAKELLFHGIAFALLAVLGGLACLGLWLGRGGSLLPLARRGAASWTGQEVFLVFVVVLTATPLVFSILQAAGFYDHLYQHAPSRER